MGIASPPAAARNDKVWMVGGQLVGNYFLTQYFLLEHSESLQKDAL